MPPHPPPGTPFEKRVLSVATASAWTGTAALLGLVATRVLALDDSAAGAAFQTALPHVLLPAWAAVGFAWTTRRRGLGAVAGLVVVAHVAWLIPELRVQVPLDDEVRAAPVLTVFSANVLIGNPRIDEVIAEIRAVDADIVLLQEYDTSARDAIIEAALFRDYPHLVEHREDSPTGSLIASKLPIRDWSVTAIAGTPMPSVVIDTPIGPVEIMNVHTIRPDWGHRQWEEQHKALAARVRGRTMPMIVAGDFNATTSHRPFRDLLSAGLTDAHRARGKGLSNSWPNDRGWIPPLVRIDHLLTTDELAVTSVRNGTGAGSDHRPVVADVALIGRR